MTASVLRTETENTVQTAFSHDVTPLSLTTRQCFSDLQEAPSGNRSRSRVFPENGGRCSTASLG